MKTTLLILALIAFQACLTPKNETGKAAIPVVSEAENKLRDIWVLHWMDGQTVDTITFTNDLPMLELNPRDSTVMGFTGCNRVNGTISANDDGQITFGPLGTTKMYCVNIPEAAFLDALTKANHYKRDGLTLWLLVNDKKLLGFKKVD